jgi:hypothetical protein
MLKMHFIVLFLRCTAMHGKSLTYVSFSYTAPDIHPSDFRAPSGSAGGGFNALCRFSQHSPKRALHLSLSPQKAHRLHALPLRPSLVPPRSNRRLQADRQHPQQ